MQLNPTLFALWRKWFNNAGSFHNKELVEMEDHLIEEMHYLMRKDNLTEEQAFLKAVEGFGIKNDIIEVETVTKQQKTQQRYKLHMKLALSTILVISFVLLFRILTLEVSPIDRTIPFGMPYKGEIIDSFKFNEESSSKILTLKKGVNIQTPYGSDVRATADGVVVEAEIKHEYGLVVVIRHSDTYRTIYAHCSVLLVNELDKVKRGQIIAKSGVSGTVITPQIHYDVVRYGSSVDPIRHNRDLLEDIQKKGRK